MAVSPTLALQLTQITMSHGQVDETVVSSSTTSVNQGSTKATLHSILSTTTCSAYKDDLHTGKRSGCAKHLNPSRPSCERHANRKDKRKDADQSQPLQQVPYKEEDDDGDAGDNRRDR